MNLVTAFLFMIPLAVVTGFVDFYYYSVGQVDIVEDLLENVLGLDGAMTETVGPLSHM